MKARSVLETACSGRIGFRLACLALAGSLVACRKADVGPRERPVDANSARVVAEFVARRSGCAGFEDYDLRAKDHWDFTCQVGDEMFLLRAVSNPTVRAARIAELESANKPFEAGETCLIWEFDSPGQASSATHLARFRDALR